MRACWLHERTPTGAARIGVENSTNIATRVFIAFSFSAAGSMK